MIDVYVPLLGGILGVFMMLTAYYVVKANDLVYASSALAILGLLNAALIALLGYTVIAIFLVIVYVGAAVMFIIVSVSMLGGGGGEERDEMNGAFAGAAVGTAFFLLLAGTGLYKAFTRPAEVSLQAVSNTILDKYALVIGILFVALAATLVEAISIARRG